jgi:protein tyrosine phosphatase (PTP) superfamily phosphohydrolase (DUF442 family)
MKQLLLLISLSMLCIYLVNTAEDPRPAAPVNKQLFTIDHATHLPDRVVPVPVGESIYFSESLCAEAMADLKALGIVSIIRLNGDGPDAGCLSIEQEADAAALHDMRLSYFNIDGGADLTMMVNMIKDGHVWIHCKHGAHRAALVAGCFMISRGLSFDEVVEIIGWTQGQHPIIRNPAYARYVQILRRWAEEHRTLS